VAHGSSRAAFEPCSKVSRDPAPLPLTHIRGGDLPSSAFSLPQSRRGAETV